MEKTRHLYFGPTAAGESLPQWRPFLEALDWAGNPWLAKHRGAGLYAALHLTGEIGAVCALAELQAACPGRIRTERPLGLVHDRRPFICAVSTPPSQRRRGRRAPASPRSERVVGGAPAS